MKVLTIDPGGVTGLAEWMDGEFRSFEWGGGYRGFAQMWLLDMQSSRLTEYDCVVIEKFTIMASTLHKTREYDALYIIGLVLSTCDFLGVHVMLQTPAQAKTFATDTKLKALGWYDSSPGGHKNDATRHLVSFLARNDREFLRHLGEVTGA